MGSSLILEWIGMDLLSTPLLQIAITGIFALCCGAAAYAARRLRKDKRPMRHRATETDPHQHAIRGTETRSRIEEIQKSSEERFQLVARATNDAVWDWNLTTNERWWNLGFQTLFLYTPEQIEPGIESWTDRLHPDDRVRVLTGIASTIERGATFWSDEYRFRRADGLYAVIFDRGYVINDHCGKAVRMIGAMMDITQRKRTEDAFRESEELFRRFMNHSPGIAWMKDGLGRYRYVNEPFERHFRTSLNEMKGKTDFDVFSEETATRLCRNDEIVAATEQGRDALETIPNPDGALVEWMVYKFPFKDANDDTFVGGIAIDVTDRRRAEEALRKSEDRYRRLVEASPDAILVIKGRRIVFMNDAGFRLLGATSQEQIIGRSFCDFLYPDFDLKYPGALVRVQLECGKNIPLTETRVLCLDGRSVEVELIATPLDDQEAPGTQVVLRDVSERKRLEGQLRQSQKMEGIGQLAGGIAHDFNNMLTIINGHSDLLLMESVALKAAVRKSLEDIRQAGHRAASLTRQLLAFSRGQAMQPKVVDLNALISNAERLLRPLIGEHIQLTTALHSELGHVKVDPAQLEQVIINLAVNARDAMPDGGQLRIRTDNVALQEPHASHHVDARVGPHVMIAVTDTGIGMDEGTKARIFEPYFTTKEKGRGMGLGLSSVYGIVKQSGGFIIVESDLNKGATFKIYLPRVDDPIDRDVDDEGARAGSMGSETVLIAEDEPGVLALVSDILRKHGYTVLAAQHAHEALAIVEQYEGPIHLLLSDVVMPGLSGRELAACLSKGRLDMKVLFMSGYTEDAVRQRGVLNDGVGYIQKPFSPEVLAEKVRRVLDARDSLSASACSMSRG
jgi:PAS domain S-box-containing protein